MKILLKKWSCVFLFAILIICITGCSPELREGTTAFEKVSENEYLVIESNKYEGETVYFRDDDILIFQNEEYIYSIDGSKNEYTISIDFPNGAETTHSHGDNFSTSTGGNIEPPESKYFILDALVAIKFNTNVKTEFNGFKILFSIALVGLGLWCVFSPKTAWYVNMGWHYKNAEPSDMGLKMFSVVGVIIIITGVVTMFTGWSLP